MKKPQRLGGARRAGVLLRGACLLIIAVLAGCGAAPRVLVKPEIVKVAVETRAEIDPVLLAPCIVTEPDPACWIGTERKFCNGQLATMREDYRNAIALCNLDKAAIAK